MSSFWDFEAPIWEDPDNDLPRLFYADWLEETGQTARAEFIRLQLALAKAKPKHPNRKWWQKRADELEACYRDAWLPEVTGRQFLHFQRGMAERLVLEQELTADQVERAVYAIRLDQELMKRVRTLQLHFVHDLTEASIRDFTTLPHLKAIELYGRRLTEPGLLRIIAIPQLTFLQLIDPCQISNDCFNECSKQPRLNKK